MRGKPAGGGEGARARDVARGARADPAQVTQL